ncbi:CPBP family intramembrane glutamic endopeptidase [Parvularcula sp. IMCC14364]|uniref:CPBP family intramembrane glutamic endopeptidase n=1 Tax=Parvularcula sp. IMCC14364 TaxID=3067902 RepID=UPI00274035AD|nr:CPBP family intramembrane glutamic endopeptidase [Parvularcula sp. IMCC14364]
MKEMLLSLDLEWPLIIPAIMIVGYLIYAWWENATRTAEADRESRLPIYNDTMLWLWGLAAACMFGWLISGRTLVELGLTATEPGWRSWAAWGAVGLGSAYMAYSIIAPAVSTRLRQQIRTQLNALDIDFMRPRTTAEHRRFKLLSVTAGITEEIIFRGFLISVLALYMPLVAAALTAIVLFGCGHFYQGVAGVIRTALIGGFLTVVYLTGGSLWPAIILHILMDLAAGAQFQIINAFDEKDSVADGAEV